MRLIPTDPDIETLLRRIEDGSLDLQPDFQRGVVWGRAKQQRLIDSILRNWHVPPIHVIEMGPDGQVVLDGQQRLVAIRDFVRGVFPIDGTIDPVDAAIAELHKHSYHNLPQQAKRSFHKFGIRVFECIDYAPEEPYELFFRLNQPTTLTSAEKRNAFFGQTREQVRNLVQYADQQGLNEHTLGFSNSRMAYDDVIARFCYALDVGSLRQQPTATVITSRYRSGPPFSNETLDSAANALKDLATILSATREPIRFNKASLHTWLCFIVGLRKYQRDFPHNAVASHLMRFERARHQLRSEGRAMQHVAAVTMDRDLETALLELYSDRISSRAGDVSSIVLRDFVLWAFFSAAHPEACTSQKCQDADDLLSQFIREYRESEGSLIDVVWESSWGSKF